MQTHDVEVLVVGLGPVGCVAALMLARRGIAVAAIEAGVQGAATDLRASTFHAPTIEMLDRLGAAGAILTHGLKAPVYQYRDRRSNETLAFDLTELSDHTRFPFRIQCEQHRMTNEVRGELERDPGVSVAYGQRLLFIEQHEDHVTAYVETPTAVECYRARYIIGADGANSIVRKVLDLEFPGFTHPEKFLCFSTLYPLETAFENLCLVNYISDPAEWAVLLRAPTAWRILVPAEETTPDDVLLSDVNKDAVFARLLKADVKVETLHRTIYRVHQRVAPSFVRGRVGLVGDAAHLNSPMGGFGMNSGIHDAVSLGEKLTAILQDGASPDLLQLYDRQRRTTTHNFIQTQSIENTELMKSGWASVSARRLDKLRSLMTDREARRAYLLNQSMFTSLENAAAIQ